VLISKFQWFWRQLSHGLVQSKGKTFWKAIREAMAKYSHDDNDDDKHRRNLNLQFYFLSQELRKSGNLQLYEKNYLKTI
jgi:hypothetical protein